MARPRALVTAPLRGPALDTLHDLADVVLDPWIDHVPIRLHGPEDLAQRIAKLDATILVCEADVCRGPVLDQPLIVIGSTRGDPTNVDLDGATAAGIPVVSAPGRNADAVAELTVGLLFAAARHLLPAAGDVRTGAVFTETLPYQRYRAWELAGRTAGLVGLGAVGRATRWRLEGLGMRVIATDPFVEEASHTLEDLLAEADVVSMHAPIGPDTAQMMGAEQFALMKPGAIYLNTARAGLHDTTALVAAVAAGHLGAVALDHVEGEVLAIDDPLLAMANVIVTPHIGGATYDTEVNQTTMIVEDVARVLRGERPVRLANPDVWSPRA